MEQETAAASPAPQAQPAAVGATPAFTPPPWPPEGAVPVRRSILGRVVIGVLAFNGVALAVAGVTALLLHNRTSEAAIVVAAALFIGSIVQLLVGLVALFPPDTRLRGVIAVVAAPAVWFASIIGMFAFGGVGWGRPLRVRGRQVYPQLTRGSDWAAGARPDPCGLDAATRAALEGLWLHDAQKEHASVPAFARISWLLAAAGAPAHLLAWAQRAALEEVDHAQRCFALAAGYGGRTHEAQPMPDLLLERFGDGEDPLQVLARESLQDGCQLEDFNADVAAACARVCEEPVTRSVLDQVAREERSHAEFSWAILQWTLERSPDAVRAAIAQADRGLDTFERPRAVGPHLWPKVVLADPAQLLRHGRIPDAELGRLWKERLLKTRERLQALVGNEPAEAGLLAA